MKNILGVFRSILISLLLMTGCNNQPQSTITPTITIESITTFSPTATPTLFLPTFTPLPYISPIPPTPLPPLPKSIFELFPEPMFDSAPLPIKLSEIIQTGFGIVSPNAVIEENILVDSAMWKTVVSLFWDEGDLELTLIQPDRKEINLSMTTPAQDFNYYRIKDDLYVVSISDSNKVRYYFQAPQAGKWTMRIFGKSTPSTGSNYMIQVTSYLATGFHLEDFNKDGYIPGESINFSFGVTDSTAGYLNAPPGYIHGASIHVTAETPNKEYSTFELYDDGLHGDGLADDGIYGNTFKNTSVKGKYNFYIQVSGILNRDSGSLYKPHDPFVREYYFSTTVK